jgi:hypothetical protein
MRLVQDEQRVHTLLRHKPSQPSGALAVFL